MSKNKQTLLEHWPDWFVALMLVERMYPNYVLFSETTTFGKPAVFRNILDLLWEQFSEKPSPVDFIKQRDKLDQLTPNSEDFDMFGVRPAVDACTAVSLLLDCAAFAEPLDVLAIKALDVSTISAYLELMGENVTEHPLLQASEALCQQVLNVTQSSSRMEALLHLREMRKMLLQSNLGIEL